MMCCCIMLLPAAAAGAGWPAPAAARVCTAPRAQRVQGGQAAGGGSSGCSIKHPSFHLLHGVRLELFKPCEGVPAPLEAAACSVMHSMKHRPWLGLCSSSDMLMHAIVMADIVLNMRTLFFCCIPMSNTVDCQLLMAAIHTCTLCFQRVFDAW